jgi:hypothetical protein
VRSHKNLQTYRKDKIMTELHDRIDQAREHFEAPQADLYRPDGGKAYSDEEHDERAGALQRELNATLDRLGPEIEKRIETAAEAVHQLEHRDPSGALTTEELERANARSAFIKDEVNGLSTDALAERMRAVASSGDRPAAFLYAHHARMKMQTFDSEAEGLTLKALTAELESALDPQGVKRREQAAKALEAARELKSYAHYRRHGARDAAELHMNRVYGPS